MSGTPKGWDKTAHALWRKGDRAGAIQAVLIPINRSSKKPPNPLLAQFAYYLFLIPDYPAAAQVLERAHSLYPNDLETLLNLATAHSRAKAYPAAIAAGLKYLDRGGREAAAYDMLANSYYRGRKFDEARAAGERALAIKDEAARPLPGTRLRPLPDGVAGRKRIIAFTLWGANPRYLRGAIHNAVTVGTVYPGWTCRFYVEATVPAEVREALVSLGSELVECGPGSSPERLCRRFFASDDSEVGHFLVRDCDSVVNEREALAVAEWLASGEPFHVMRDWWTHTDPMLAGMWGGIAGVLPPMRRMLAAYRPRHVETPNWDQWFLRDCVWALVRDQAVVHDRYFASRNARPFPGGPPPGNRHVGQDEFAVRRAEQAEAIRDWIARLPSLRLPGEA